MVNQDSGLFDGFCSDFLGLECHDPVFTFEGTPELRRRTYLDSGATTLMAGSVWRGMQSYLETASANSHTLANRAGRDTTLAIEKSRDSVGRLVGYEPERDVVLFTANGATGATNFLARALFPPELRLLLKGSSEGPSAVVIETFKRLVSPSGAPYVDRLLERPLIVTTEMEHHSNLLPWMEAVGHHHIRAVPVKKNGTLDMDAFLTVMEEEGEHVRLVAVSGLSNVTGIINPVHQMATIAHRYGAQIVVDGAQWVPHSRVRMHTGVPEESIDFLVISGHKFYAPGSRGALIGTLETLEACRCVSDVGWGMVEYVTLDDFELKATVTAREEAGTPNIPGSIAMGLIAEVLMKVGMETLEEAEHALTSYLLKSLGQISEIRIYGESDLAVVQRGGVVSFNVQNLEHGLVAAFLNDYHNVAVRNGCFCAQPYGMALMECELSAFPFKAVAPTELPGMVRASLGAYSTAADVDALCVALKDLVANSERVKDRYVKDPDGNYIRRDGEVLPRVFSIKDRVGLA